MNYENKSKDELIEIIKEKDIEILKLKKRKTPGKKKFNDENIIRLMYDMYLSNNSLGSIANFLNASNVKTPLGRDWDRSSINVILSNKENQKKFLTEEMISNFINQKKKNTRNFKEK